MEDVTVVVVVVLVVVLVEGRWCCFFHSLVI